MKLKIEKGVARGRINAPPSKSMAHRLLIAAAMCDGVSVVRGVSDCDDVNATVDCLSALGAKFSRSGNDVTVYGCDMRGAKASSPLVCRESGSTLRFMIPIAMLSKNTTVFYGAPSLMARPMRVYEELFSDRGLTFISDGSTIVTRGELTGGAFTVVGNVSSQFISGLLFALPLAKEDSVIKITPPLESRSYINLTINALRTFGVVCCWTDEYTISIKGNQKYRPSEVTVEGDYSGSAFTEAFNLFGGNVEVLGLAPDTLQGDSIYRRYYAMLDNGMPTIHIGDCPDLGPILFAVAAAKCGGVFSGTKRLKIKESDRASAMATELQKFGAKVSVYEDSVVVYPAEFHSPTEELESHKDHRIVMALSVLLTLTGGVINGAEAVSKSYPEFFSDIKALGIEVNEI
jgi:3-phosphoshikimate 1-carboxyvinyltransferase